MTKGASSSGLRQAYRKGALLWHPDKHNNSDEATEKFAALRASFELLLDPSERQAFERFQQASGEMTDQQEGRSYEDIERERTEGVGLFYGQAGQRGEVDMLNAAAFAAIKVQAMGKVQDLWAKHQATPSKISSASSQLRRIWLLEFYAPWCPHCQNLKPYFLFAGSKLQKKWGDSLRVGVVDCVENRDFCQAQNIMSYPEVRAFAFGIGRDGKTVVEEATFEEHTHVHYSLIPGRIVKFVKKLFDKFEDYAVEATRVIRSVQTEGEVQQLRKDVEQLRNELSQSNARVTLVEAENERLKAQLASDKSSTQQRAEL